MNVVTSFALYFIFSHLWAEKDFQELVEFQVCCRNHTLSVATTRSCGIWDGSFMTGRLNFVVIVTRWCSTFVPCSDFRVKEWIFNCDIWKVYTFSSLWYWLIILFSWFLASTIICDLCHVESISIIFFGSTMLYSLDLLGQLIDKLKFWVSNFILLLKLIILNLQSTHSYFQ